MAVGRFIPVPLPRWELRLSYAVWIFHSLAAFVISYRVCHNIVYDWIQHWLRDSDYLSDWKMDLADAEWLYYRHTVGYLIVAYTGHSIIFNLINRYCDSASARTLQIVSGVILHVLVTSPSCIGVLTVFAVFVIGITVYSRRQLPGWLLCILFILIAAEYVPFSTGRYIYYREFNMYLYNAIKILNVCIHLSRNASRPMTREFLLEILHYMTYLPYSMTLIVLFEEFQQQIKDRVSRQQSTDEKDGCIFSRYWSTAFFAFRLLFWGLFFEFLLHIIPVNALFASPFSLISGLKPYELSSIAYVAGQYFHLKYVVIFGVPALFARIDGMTPPAPPICISRVSRYSRMWRHFDAGLYSFLKNQVYVPILTCSSLPRAIRPVALVAAFGVVLAWHGTKRHFVCWVLLSALELVIEKTGVTMWETASFQKFRERVGELWTRRLVALSMLGTVIPGIFGVFFFLGTEGIGETIFNQVLKQSFIDFANLNIGLVDGVPTAGFVFLNLVILGYFFNNVCLELEHRPKGRLKSE